MKKLFSLILAMALTLSMSTAVFADEVSYTPTEATPFNEIVKTYTSENNVVVNETLSFTSEAQTTNPDGGAANLKVDDLKVSSLNPEALTVTIPSLSKAGTYEWIIKETAGSTAGVTYSEDEVHVLVLVEYDNTNHALKIANTTSYIKGVKGENDEVVKKDTFTNTFNSGSFTVAKDVIGNMANENDEFEFTVTLTSEQPIGTNITVAGTTVTPEQWTNDNGTWTYTYTADYSEAAGAKTFANIPVGVHAAVTENNVNSATNATVNGYKFAGLFVDGNNKLINGGGETITDADNNRPFVVTNEKTSEITTGINMDSMPYILLLAVVCVGLVGFVVKRRSSRY